MYADMHIHTCFSDGTQTPEKVAAIAKDRGISIISISDHNTIEAYDRLRPACNALGLTLIQGVELDVSWGGTIVHLLAYNFDPDDKAMLELIDRNQAEYKLEGLTLVENMAKDYPALSLEDYAAYKKPPHRGGWKSINYLYDRGLCEDLLLDGFKFIKQYGKSLEFDSMETACEIIRSAGGVPVLAHPGMYWIENEVPGKLFKLLAAGIGGLECYYPVHTQAFTKKCVDFCKLYDLCITCGCDSHGDFAQNYREVVCDIGMLKIDTSLLNLQGII
ncbi:MAG: PHP domain-containing protein [Defluviitaleaceae bacterium]|nr:PHP domain-containing protein [Defluviitaleaceae bacterium]